MRVQFSEPALPADLPESDREVSYVSMPGVSFGGTTLLAFLLNAHPECVSLGEASGIVGGTAIADYDCSCGDRFTQCAFWRRMQLRLEELGHPMELYRSDFWDTHLRAASNRYLDAVLIRSLRSDALNRVRDAVVGPFVRRKLEASVHASWAFARAALDVSGRRVFVDSAKDHLRPRVLDRIRNLDVRAIHLVRDARGHAASIMKRGRRPGAAAAARRWRRTNLEVIRSRAALPPDRWLEVRYDHLCRDPQATLDRIADFIGVARAPVPEDFAAVEHHIVGNPMRLRGAGQVREDLSWQQQLSESDLRTIARIAGPLNRSFGFDWP